MTGRAVPVIGLRAQGAGLRAVAIDAPTCANRLPAAARGRVSGPGSRRWRVRVPAAARGRGIRRSPCWPWETRAGGCEGARDPERVSIRMTLGRQDAMRLGEILAIARFFARVTEARAVNVILVDICAAGLLRWRADDGAGPGSCRELPEPAGPGAHPSDRTARPATGGAARRTRACLRSNFPPSCGNVSTCDISRVRCFMQLKAPPLRVDSSVREAPAGPRRGDEAAPWAPPLKARPLSQSRRSRMWQPR